MSRAVCNVASSNSHFFHVEHACDCCQLAFGIQKSKPAAGFGRLKRHKTRKAISRTHPIAQVAALGGPCAHTLRLQTRPSRPDRRCSTFTTAFEPTPAPKRPLHGTAAGFAWSFRPRDSADLPNAHAFEFVVETKKSRLKRCSADEHASTRPAPAERTGAGAINCYADRP